MAKKKEEKKKGRNCLIVVVLLIVFVGLIGNQIDDGKKKGFTPIPTPKMETEDLVGKVNFDGAQFHITNLEDRDWVMCYFVLNKNYYYPSKASDWMPGERIGAIEAGSIISLGSAQFTLKDGTRFNPFATKPQDFAISCENGFGYWGW